MREFDLYIVPTPIGNLGDMTNRAIEVLRFVDVIACEDSRNTQKLLNHFSISTKCISYHKFNERERVNQFINLINEGKKIALVSDAGTPLFCDPGAILVKELKESGARITALPGANAVATFLSQVPRENEEYTFIGFLPKSKKQIVEIIAKHKSTNLIFYESPKRLVETLKVISEFNMNAIVSVGRELTKVFEEVITDNVKRIINHFSIDDVRGELVVMVHPINMKNSAEEYSDKIKILKEKNFSDKDISVILSVLYDIPKNDIYECLLDKK